MKNLITIPLAEPAPTVRILTPANTLYAPITPLPVADPRVQALCRLMADILRDRIRRPSSQIAESN